jgi:hypothetical protein
MKRDSHNHFGASLVVLALALGASSQSLNAQPYPHQDPPALAFDQIDRILLKGEAPPPINSFAADAVNIASLPSLTTNVPTISAGKAAARGAGNMLMSSALSMIPIAGPFIAGAASQGMNAALQAADRKNWEEYNSRVWRVVTAGALTHFAFYRGWSRSESRNEITIVKPDEKITLLLDSVKRTYREIGGHDDPDVIEVDATVMAPPTLVEEPVTERLPDVTISGVTAHGYRTRATIALTHIAGWCAAGRHEVVQVEYVTDLLDPQPPADKSAVESLGDGCTPSTTASYREPGRLVLYRATTADPGKPYGATWLFERDNLRKLEERDAARFSVPPDFTKEK